MLDAGRGLACFSVRLRDGDHATLAQLYRELQPRLRIAVRKRLNPDLRSRFDSLDFVQDVWTAFLHAGAKREFASEGELLAYLSGIAHHKVMDMQRKRMGSEKDCLERERPLEHYERGHALPQAETAATPSQCVIAGEEYQVLLSKFKPAEQAVIRRLREGYTNEDISRLTEVSLSTVNRVIRRLKGLVEG